MVDVPRALDPSDHERLDVLRRAMTAGNVDGESRAVGPIFRRDQLDAGVTGGAGDDVNSTSSKIDEFAITGAGTSAFTLTFDPVDDSWNVTCSWDLVSGVDYTIDGQTLTILDPATVFIGASGTYPKTLQVQYDYLDGVPVAPSEIPVVVGADAKGGNNPTLASFTSPEAGDLMILVVGIFSSGGSITTPTGFTQYGTDITSFNTLFRIFTKTAAGGETSLAISATGGSGRTVAGLVILRNGSIQGVSGITNGAPSPQPIPVGTGYSNGQLGVSIACVELGVAVGLVGSHPSPYVTEVRASDASTGTGGVQSGNGNVSVGIGVWTADAGSSPTVNLAATGTLNSMNIRVVRFG